MVPASERFEDLLQLEDDSKQWFKDEVLRLLEDRSAIPAFSATTMRLMELTREDDAPVDELQEVIAMDPGLGTQCIRAANSVEFGGRNITSVDQAILVLGMNNVGRIALTAGVMDRFSHLRIKVDWLQFWQHSLLVARLTQRIAAAFFEANGSDYLAGLLHDVGKLLLEHYFPRDFEEVLMRSTGRRQAHHVSESELLGLNHAQVGAAMCRAIGVHQKVLHAIRYHHEPNSETSLKAPFANRGLLATCVAVANAAAKGIDGGFENAEELTDVTSIPEWGYLDRFDRLAALDVDLVVEKARVQDDLRMLAV